MSKERCRGFSNTFTERYILIICSKKTAPHSLFYQSTQNVLIFGKIELLELGFCSDSSSNISWTPNHIVNAKSLR